MMEGSGTVKRVQHTPGSGLVTIWIAVDDGGPTMPVHCDAGPFFRAVHELHGRGEELIGRRITYTVTDFGGMESFSMEENEA